MSTEDSQTVGFGVRLREERERLGIKQDGVGVSAKTQWMYEKGERSPDIPYLSAFAARGADVLYIVTGLRAAANLTPDVQQLVSAYLTAAPTLRAAALAVLATGSVPSSGAQLTFEGAVGAAVVGDATFKGPLVGKKARKK